MTTPADALVELSPPARRRAKKPLAQSRRFHEIVGPEPEAPAAAETSAVSLDDPSLYMNRELSLLEFQRRVLAEARDPHNKLLERVKFISIVSSNLDEFFMVRVAALKQKLAAGRNDLSIDGKTVTQQLEAVHASVDQLMLQIYDCFQNQLLPE